MREKLKSCPFCGSKAIRNAFDKKVISCSNNSCPCCPMTCSNLFDTSQQASEAWNRRVK